MLVRRLVLWVQLCWDLALLVHLLVHLLVRLLKLWVMSLRSQHRRQQKWEMGALLRLSIRIRMSLRSFFLRSGNSHASPEYASSPGICMLDTTM